jgi:hypothetical protein
MALPFAFPAMGSNPEVEPSQGPVADDSNEWEEKA